MPYTNINDPWRDEEETPEIKANPPSAPATASVPDTEAPQQQPVQQPVQQAQPQPMQTGLAGAAEMAFAIQRDPNAESVAPWEKPTALSHENEARFDETPAPQEEDPYDPKNESQLLLDAARAGWGATMPDGNGGRRMLTAQDVSDYRQWRWDRMKDLEAKYEYIKMRGGSINVNDFDSDKFYEESIRGNRDFAANLTDRGAKALDSLEKRINETYDGMVEARTIGTVAYDSIRRAVGDAAKFGREIGNFVGVQTGAISDEEWAKREKEIREIENRVKALHPTKVGSVQEIDTFADAGIWAMERLGEQSINLISCFLGGGLAAAGVKGLAKAGLMTAGKAAARAQAARMTAGWVGTGFFNAGDVIGQAADEAMARGETVSALRVLPEAAGYIALDNFGATIRGLRRLGGADAVKMAERVSKGGILVSGRQTVRTLPRAAREWAKDAMFEGATEALQSGVVTRLANYLSYGTAFSQDELNAEGGPARAALWGAAEEFLAGAVVGMIPGAFTTTLKARSDKQLLLQSDRVLERFANGLTDAQLKKLAANDAAGPLGRLFSDLAEGKLANTNLEAEDRIMLASAIANDILSRQTSVAQPGMSEELAKRRDAVLEALGEDAREWYRAYTGGWSYGQSIEDVPETGPGGANAPDTGVSQRARTNCLAEIGSIDHKTESPVFYTDGTGSGDVGRIAFQEFTETDADGKKHRVIRVARLDGGPMPFNGANEFHVDDFDGSFEKAREAAFAYGCDLSSWIKYTDSMDAQVVSAAKDYLTRTGRGGDGVNVILVGNAEEAENALVNSGLSLDENGRRQMFGVKENGTKNSATGLARGFRGVTLGGGSTIILNRNEIKGQTDLAAVIDHEFFHAEFAQYLAQNGSSLRKELELPDRIPEGSAMERRI
ncbi:MAG: hypothetical protein IIZ06_04445, partial [Kiritimatiellae bacterium]|nr:hypothetical protein [Kiritimatiellia bacterium]